MAIAKAEMTLYSVIDISKVTRYYILKSSTASTPSVPTTNPPSGWTTTEPTYTSGSTNTLYFVDLTEFTNGTFKYSAVSKSSSYEAAKEAYNKALNAQNSADDAAKTATNYMKYDSSKGLVISENVNASSLGKNVLIDSDSFNIRNNDTILASFEDDAIYLARNNPSALIDLGNGSATMQLFDESYDSSDGSKEWLNFKIKSQHALALESFGKIRLDSTRWYTNSVASGGLQIAPDDEYNLEDSFTPYAQLFIEEFFDSGTVLRSSSVYMDTIGIRIDTSYSADDIDAYATITLDINESESVINLSATRIKLEGMMSISEPLGLSSGGTGGNSVNTARANLKTWGYGFVGDDTTYPGLVRPNGTDTGYVRTPQSGLLPYKTGGASTVGTSSWPFNNGYFKNLYANGVNLTAENWTTATLTSKFANYNGVAANAPKYRKIGKIVNIRGVVSPTEDIVANTTQHTIFTLPTGYRPAINVATTCEGSAGNHWLCMVSSEGNVTFSRYSAGGSEWKTVTTTTWLPFNITFTID